MGRHLVFKLRLSSAQFPHGIFDALRVCETFHLAAIGGVRHVIPIWEAAFPEKSGPGEMIVLAQSIVEGRRGEEAKQSSERFQVYSENLGYDRGHEVAALVGTAASKLIPLALYDAYWGQSTESDEDLDPDLWDPSYVASMAAANGAVRASGSNNDARGVFWRWYLREAAPAAYETVPT